MNAAEVKSPIVAAYLKGIETADTRDIEAYYASDVRLDVTLPEWRFSWRGRDKVVGWLQEAAGLFAGTARLSDVRVFAAANFVALQYELHCQKSEDGKPPRPVGFREFDIFVLEDGKVTEQIMHCTGEWSEAVFERIAREAPKAE
jgi:hypothetical protein